MRIAAFALILLLTGCASVDHLELGPFADLPVKGQERAVTDPKGLVIDPKAAMVRLRDLPGGDTEAITTWTDDSPHYWIGRWNSGGGPVVDMYGPGEQLPAVLATFPDLAIPSDP